MKPPELNSWPVSIETLEAGRAFLRDAAARTKVAIACDKDVDGLTSGLIIYRALERLGARDISIFPAHKGEHAHAESFRQRLAASKPKALIVTDMGARSGVILSGVPTLIVDHHQPQGYPPGALVVSAAQAAPVPSSSVLAFILVETLFDAGDLCWLAVLGGIADLADDMPYPDFKATIKQCGSKHISETIALLNAARRSSRDEVEAALKVLMAAAAPKEISSGSVPGVEILRACRAEVSAAFKQHLRLAPKFSKTLKVALLRFSSPTQIHPIIATRWAGTLKKFIVIAANDGYLPGRVNFSLRTELDEHLPEFLKKHAPDLQGEFGYGHRQATAGNLSPENFAVLLERLGFPA